MNNKLLKILLYTLLIFQFSNASDDFGIQNITMNVTVEMGRPDKVQTFTHKTKGIIHEIDALEIKPPIGGYTKIKGIGTNIAIVNIRTAGMPGQIAKSIVSFKVIYKKEED